MSSVFLRIFHWILLLRRTEGGNRNGVRGLGERLEEVRKRWSGLGPKAAERPAAMGRDEGEKTVAVEEGEASRRERRRRERLKMEVEGTETTSFCQ